MLRSVVVGQFFRDLKNPAYTTAFAVYHRRFSTNTTPKWPLAQPMRVLGHNGAPAAALPASTRFCMCEYASVLHSVQRLATEVGLFIVTEPAHAAACVLNALLLRCSKCSAWHAAARLSWKAFMHAGG